MEIHEAVAVGSLVLDYTPTEPDHAVRLQDLFTLVRSNPIFITDVVPTLTTGSVGEKLYASTVPEDMVLLSCTTNTSSVTVHFLAEGGTSSYSPSVVCNGITAELTELPNTKRIFSGKVSIGLNESSAVLEVKSSTGASAHVSVTYSVDGPFITEAYIIALPTGQYTLKENDLMQVEGVVQNEATEVRALALYSAKDSAFTLGPLDSAGPGLRTFSGTVTASNASGYQTLVLEAVNSIGSAGEPFDLEAFIEMDQTYPVIDDPHITYNNGNLALDIVDTATVTSAVIYADSVTYEFLDGTVNSPTTYSESKTVTAIADRYSNGPNYTITATRNSNKAVSTKSVEVRVASEGAVLSVTLEPTVSSSVEGTDYEVTFTSTQRLTNELLITPSIGTLSDVYSVNDTVFVAILTIKDSDPKGTLTFSIDDVVNDAGVPVSIGAHAFAVAGFSGRVLVFAPFSQSAPIGTSVYDPLKTKVAFAGTQDFLVYVPHKNVQRNAYTFVNSDGTLNPNGDHLWLNDADLASSNTSGYLKFFVEEVV